MKQAAFWSTILICSAGVAQKSDLSRHSFYFEAFGQGIYNSLSYDRILKMEKNKKTSVSAGITTIPHPVLLVSGIPVSYNWLFGKSPHHLEVGIGLTVMHMRRGQVMINHRIETGPGIIQEQVYSGHSHSWFVYLTPKIGYRFQREDGGMFLRVALTPVVALFNRIGPIKGGPSGPVGGGTALFTEAAFFTTPVMPWGGISIGFTLKKRK